MRRLAANVIGEPSQMHAAGIRLEDTEHHPHRGGLACAVRADESEDLARPDVEAEIVERLERAVSAW